MDCAVGDVQTVMLCMLVPMNKKICVLTRAGSCESVVGRSEFTFGGPPRLCKAIAAEFNGGSNEFM